jgi:zinc transporter
MTAKHNVSVTMPRDNTAETAPSCLVFGYVLDGKGGGTPIETGALSDRPTWLHIDYSASTTVSWLRDAGLAPEIVESLVRPETRPRALVTRRGMLVVLRGINTNPESNPEDMVSLRIWIEPNRMITVRHRRVLVAQDVGESLEAGQGPRDLPDLLIHLIERLADRIGAFIDNIEDQILAFEGQVETDRPGAIRSQVSTLRRQTAVVRRFVAPLREALEALCRQAEGTLEPPQIFAVRDQSDRIVRSVEDLDLIRERALVVQEELLNRITQQQNDRLYLFSVVAAIFLPITFITGLFGMNTGGLPGLEEPRASWVVFAAMLVVTAGTIMYLRIKKWF